MHPTKQKAPNGAESTTKISVFTTSFGNCGAKFCERQCAKDGEDSAHDPGSKHDGDETSFAYHFRGLEEDAGAHHGADDDGRRGPRSQTAHKFQTLFAHTPPRRFMGNECRPPCST